MATREARLQQVTDFSNEIKARFESSGHWEYERFLGNGSYGITVLLRERDQLAVNPKRIALKLARKGSPSGMAQLRNELKFLKTLRGAMHIVRMASSCDNLHSINKEADSRSAFGPLQGLMKGPAVALEYLDKGDLVTLKIDIDGDQTRMPNKVLWSLFLCLIRACIGMAYPLERPEETQSVLETVPADGTRPRGIIHQDLATRNIVLGSGDGLDEHHVGYLFKLIDFGSTSEYDLPRGPRDNLYDCARLMLQMLDYEPIFSFPTVWREELTRVGSILPPEDNPNDDPFPHVDFDLRDLIARCLYVDAQKRPTLQEALEEAQRAVARDPDTFPDPEEETDERIRDFFQKFIHDVPDNMRVRG
ncbi:kinase-like domain-containing protein [Xylaria flabelliformis]|nr:kinase-like domain-containing protein [Xylaria flabelliformis]